MLTKGQAQDGPWADDLFDGIAQGDGRLAERRARAFVKPMPNRKCVPACSPSSYRYSNFAENFFNEIRCFRTTLPRHAERDDTFLASVQLA